MGPLAKSLSFLICKILMTVPILQVLFLDGKMGDGNVGGILENSRHKHWESRNAYGMI